ncbi:hypothetical protein J7T55_003346 [Diaporthe amygdali]|uniref:uncharacterized protein n=1 Tax=Phomopsis amygdali TaxID=1214568 RepID=UPI0022FE63D8|nr:uncharacterized protein J7T55_003346 [Diaporthe amygdali]KAJ0116932.1 hypothetical protein J7T55_003346 [Diaporthe amygdali]
MLFPNADDPGRDLDHLDESWSNIQEWADLSLNLPASNEETIANAIDTQMEIIYNVPIKLVGNMLQISETINSDADQSFDIFLQDPEEDSETVPYYNPQEARFPGIEEPVSIVLDRSRAAVTSSKGQKNELESEIMSQAIATIYRSLKRFRIQDQQKGGARVLTNLLQELPRIKSTLIIVPSTLIVNSWMKQIETHIEKSFKAVAYYGKDRDANSDAYFDSDVVFTTYHTVAASINLPNNLIVPIQWFRIVLDEAHMIRRPQTTLFQAASQLSARFRWCLTGTPIQNRLEDVGSLLSFLRVPHLENKAVFQKYVILPFEEDPEEACRKFAFLLDCICLRRPQTLLYLPKMVETVHYLDLSPSEQQQYRNTMQAMSKMLQRKAGQGPGKKVTFGLFQAQLQLRLLCNHGTFQKRITDTIERDTQAESEDIMYSLGRQADDSCSICSIQISIFDTQSWKREKLPYVRIDGSQSSSQRQYNLDRFTSYHWIPILLMSTGVGAVGLNLTAANRVYIVEPQWNPSIESQAIGRISRIGQERTVYVTRYLIRGTVEMKMYSQQVRKIELAKIGLKN